MKHKIKHFPKSGVQPWEVYAIVGKNEVWRGSFSTEDQAKTWIEKYGARPVQGA